MGINRPKDKAEVISGVTQGTPVNKKEGTKAAEHFDGKLKQLYDLARKAKLTVTEAAAMTGDVDPKARSFSEKAVKALNNQLNKIAEITHNLREEAKERLGQKGPAQKPEAPKSSESRFKPRG